MLPSHARCTRRAVRHVALAFPLAALIGPTPATAQSTRDSAGISVVENPARLAAPVRFTLGKPILEVGGAEANPGDQFDFNQGYLRGVRLSNRDLVVIDVNRVHYFDSTGRRYKIQNNRRTNNPVGFLYLMAICRTRGDTVLVSDAHMHYIAVLDRTGALVRTIPMQEGQSTQFNFCFDDGTFVTTTRTSAPASTTASSRLTRMRLDGSVANVLGEFRTPSLDFVTFFEVAHTAVGESYFYGEGAGSQLVVMDTTGRIRPILRSADPAVAITPEQVEERLAGMIPMNVSVEERAQRLERIRARPHAATWPPYGRIHVDGSGRLWVQDYRIVRPSPDMWSAFDEAGRLLGRLIIPPDLGSGTIATEVIGFGTDEILIRRFDSNHMLHLGVYPIVAQPIRR